MSEKNGKVCCNCRHNIRIEGEGNIQCHCNITDHWIGCLQCMTRWCKHWSKEMSNHDRE